MHHDAVTRDSTPLQPLRLTFDRFELDEADARLASSGKAVPLAPRPFAVLCALARSPGRLVTKNELLDAVWGHRFVTESVLKTTISELRAALEDDARKPRCIETVARRGYRFIAPIAGVDARLPATAAMEAPATLPTPPADIVGRHEAMERLRTAWRRAREGRRQVVWIAGEAGVGKTTLMEAFIAEVGESACAHGQCVEQYGAGEPYLPVLEALTALCRRDASLVEQVRAIAPTWLLQIPSLATAEERERLLRETSGAGPARMLREMGDLLERCTAERPLLLVTEDLHWADQATVQLIDHIARRRGPMRLLWLASFRLTEVIASGHPLGALRHELRLHRLNEEIVLDAFSEREVAELLARRLPALSLDEAFVRALHARTEGLPLFVAGVVDDLAATGGQAGGGAHSLLDATAIPDTLSGVVERYIAELTPAQHGLLEAASVCGVEFRLETVSAALEGDPGSVADLVTELARRQRWLIEMPAQATGRQAGYAFRHALYREVLYSRIGPVARHRLHRKVAQALVAERARGAEVSAAELASHFDLGREPMQALAYYAQAAEAALHLLSPQEAFDLTERALGLAPLAEEGEARTTLEMTLASLQGTAALLVFGIGSRETRAALMRAQASMETVPMHPLRGLFLHALGLALYVRGEAEEAEAAAARWRALGQANGDAVTLFCADFAQGLVPHLRGRPREASDWFHRAAQTAGTLASDVPSAVLIADPGVLLFGFHALDLLSLGRVVEARAQLERSRSRAAALGSPAPRQASLWIEATFEQRIGNAARVAELARELGVLAEELEMPQLHAANLWFDGWSRARLGDPRSGLELIRKGLEEAMRLNLLALKGEVLGCAAESCLLAGDSDEAAACLAEAMQHMESTGDRQYAVQLMILDAQATDARGDRRGALERSRRAVAEARAQQAPWLEMLALTALCECEGSKASDREALGLVLDQISAEPDCPPLTRARALLGHRG